MADETNRPDETASTPEGAGAEAQAAAAAASARAEAKAEATATSDAGDAVAKLTADVEKLESQIADLTDRLLRAHAEMDNLRKRAEREKEETAKYAITKFAREIVNVADNFERAVQAVPAGAAEENPTLKALVEGVTMTERAFISALEKSGVRRINPKGETFNPHQHQAVMEVQNPDVASGTVTEVFQAGYVIDDRCLRPAMVVVAKGGLKQPKPADAPPAEPTPDTGK